MKIRRALPQDLEEIRSIYNQAIRETTATFDTQEKTREEMEKWFLAHCEYPVLVAEAESTKAAEIPEADVQIVGWACLSAWSPKGAYRRSAEVTVYVSPAYQLRGIGRRLLQEIVEAGKKSFVRNFMARIVDGNPVSIRVHENLGFQKIGVMKGAGEKFGQVHDVVLLQRNFLGGGKERPFNLA